jgi:hypothetical protein
MATSIFLAEVCPLYLDKDTWGQSIGPSPGARESLAGSKGIFQSLGCRHVGQISLLPQVPSCEGSCIPSWDAEVSVAYSRLPSLPMHNKQNQGCFLFVHLSGASLVPLSLKLPFRISRVLSLPDAMQNPHPPAWLLFSPLTWWVPYGQKLVVLVGSQWRQCRQL